jgi:hypothetical protein
MSENSIEGKRPSSPDPISRAQAIEWMRQAVEEGDPPGMIECWHCGQWRKEEDRPCDHCGAMYIPF